MENYESYIGTTLDERYKINKLCGVGGMAIVFRAEDMLMNRTVAIKMLKDDIANDAESVQRFINESKAVAMLSHENIVNIYDVSVKEKLKYIVMEYIEGTNLKVYAKRKGILGLDEMLGITEQILRALDHAHSKGVIHRDIKPQNIMVLKNGLIKVADFGIAKIPDTDTLTANDKAIGTVHYISPEQARGKEIDAKSDLYSVGVVMYELACGKLPFTADTPVSVALKQINEQPEPPKNIKGDIPQGLDQIIMRAMEKEPEQRYQSAKQMLKHVKALKENHAIRFKAPETIAAKKALSKKKGSKKEENEDGSKKRVVVRGTMLMPTVYGVLSAFLIVVAIVAIIIFYQLAGSMNDTTHKEIEIDLYTGVKYSDSLKAQLEDFGYSVVTKPGPGDETIPIGTIVTQNISIIRSGGTDLVVQKQDSAKTVKYDPTTEKIEITFYIYEGEQTVALPDFTMEKSRDVIVNNQYSFTFKEIREYNDVIPEGYVIKSDPPSGTQVELDAVITLYVSRGEKNVTVKMPNLIGTDGTEAIRDIVSKGLVIGEIKYLPNEEYPRDAVIKQSVDANTEIPVNTVVDIILSEGPTETEPPETEAPETEEDDGWDFPWFF